MLTNMGIYGIIPLVLVIAFLWAAFYHSWKGKLTLIHPEKGKTRVAPIGFSWTTLIFGGFPALFRGHFFAAVVIFILTVVTSGLASLIFPFIYNKWYVKSLIKKGFKVSNIKGNADKIKSSFKHPLPIVETSSIAHNKHT